jgi:polysaccharide biosynthesis protein PelE
MWLNEWITNPNTLLGYWIVYSLVCIPLVYCIVWSLPLQYKAKSFWTFIGLLIIALTLPFLGIFIVFLIGCILTFVQWEKKPPSPFLTVDLPTYQHAPHVQSVAHGEGGGFKAVMNPTLSKKLRKNLLVVMNQMHNAQVNAINIQALGDDVDEIRLYAQALMEKQERGLANQAAYFTKACAHAKNKKEEATYKKALAHILWEQMYKDLISPANREAAYQKIENYAKSALEVLKNDGELPIVLAKVALAQSSLEKARTWLHQAQKNQAPEYKMNSYLAEIAYQEKQFSAIKPLLKNKTIVNWQPILSFWAHHD